MSTAHKSTAKHIMVELPCPCEGCQQRLVYRCTVNLEVLRQCPCARYWLKISWDTSLSTYYCSLYKPT